MKPLTRRERGTKGFACPLCGGRTAVVDARGRVTASVFYRRRQCVKCGYRFSTYETIEREAALDFQI